MLLEQIGVFTSLETLSGISLILTGILIIWELIWKGFGLWYSARNKNNIWFIFILIINSAGILPIIYFLTHREQIRKLKK